VLKLSRERRRSSQRKIRRIKRKTEDSTFKLESEPSETKPQGLAPNTKMYYTKVTFGVSMGGITGLLLVLSDIFFNWWLLILIIAFVLCVVFVRFVLKISDDQIDQKRLWLSGTFTFLVLFIAVTSLVWMIFTSLTI
jgi:heme/copper-type cytochrome/quinol oxidase subunit 4